MIKKPFVILADNRTGSTWLQSLLNDHPEIFCGSELFGSGIDPPWGKEIDDKILDLRENSRYIQILKAFYAADSALDISPAVTYMGFKFFYNHQPLKNFNGLDDSSPGHKFLSYLINLKDLKIIHLQRRNLLKCYTSLVLAKKERDWFSSEDLKNKITKVKIDFEDFKYFVKKRIRAISLYKTFFKGCDMISIYYEDLVSNQLAQLNRLLQFLGVSVRPLSLSFPSYQMHPEHISNYISNYSSLKECCNNTNLREFFND